MQAQVNDVHINHNNTYGGTVNCFTFFPVFLFFSLLFLFPTLFALCSDVGNEITCTYNGVYEFSISSLRLLLFFFYTSGPWPLLYIPFCLRPCW